MEKIVLVSREPSDLKRLVALVECVFPECAIEIVEKAGGRLPRRNELSEIKALSRGELKELTGAASEGKAVRFPNLS